MKQSLIPCQTKNSPLKCFRRRLALKLYFYFQENKSTVMNEKGCFSCWCVKKQKTGTFRQQTEARLFGCWGVRSSSTFIHHPGVTANNYVSVLHHCFGFLLNSWTRFSLAVFLLPPHDLLKCWLKCRTTTLDWSVLQVRQVIMTCLQFQLHYKL